MARERRPPTARLRRLASELLALRQARNLSREDVQEATGINAATLYKIEKAQAKPQPRTLKALLAIYQASAEKQDLLTILLREAGQQTWVQPYQEDLPAEYNTLIGFESEARYFSTFGMTLIPGLLQTENHARAVIRGMLPGATDDEVERRVSTRMKRQEALDHLSIWAIVDEAALRRQVGTRADMREQLEHLRAAADRPTVTLQVMPFDAGPHPAQLGAFAILKFGEPGLTDIVYVEALASDLFLEDEESVRRYTETFEFLRAGAASPAQTNALLDRMVGEL